MFLNLKSQSPEQPCFTACVNKTGSVGMVQCSDIMEGTDLPHLSCCKHSSRQHWKAGRRSGSGERTRRQLFGKAAVQIGWLLGLKSDSGLRSAI